MRLRFLLYALLTCTGLSACAREPAPPLSWHDAAPLEPARAFGQARWGMSRGEIEAAQGVSLRAADPTFHDLFGPEGIARERLGDFEWAGASLDGVPVTVSYRLLDGRLYQVHLEQFGPDALRERDAAIRAALGAGYGAGAAAPPQREDELQAHDWRRPDRRVRYWMLDDETEPPERRIYIGIEITDPASAAAVE